MSKIVSWLKKEVQETRALLKSLPTMVVVIFIMSVVLMNVLANKSLDTGSLTWLALDSGILISWIIFLTMDIIVRHKGPKGAMRLTILALVVNLCISLIFMLVAIVPGFWGESFTDTGIDLAINSALNRTIAGSWYILLGSSIAYLASALINTGINVLIGSIYKKKGIKERFWTFTFRSITSTVVAQFMDNLIFALIVSLNFFGWSFTQCITCSALGALIETLFEFVFIPAGYRLWVRIKEEEKKVGNKRHK